MEQAIAITVALTAQELNFLRACIHTTLPTAIQQGGDSAVFMAATMLHKLTQAPMQAPTHTPTPGPTPNTEGTE